MKKMKNQAVTIVALTTVLSALVLVSAFGTGLPNNVSVFATGLNNPRGLKFKQRLSLCCRRGPDAQVVKEPAWH